RTAMVLGLVLALGTPAFADDSDETLRFFLSKSDLVVLGEITSKPDGIVDEKGVWNYVCDFRIAEVLKGQKPGADTIRINIVRIELNNENRLPELKKGGKCILFLKKAGVGVEPAWQSADSWFGFQRPSPWMARSLKRLAGQGEA